MMRLFVLSLCCALAPPASAQGNSSLRDEARQAVAEGRNIDALAALTSAIAAAPQDDAAYVERGHLFDELGHPELAAVDYRVAAKLIPQDAGLQDSLCLDLALTNHDLDRALVACNAAVRIAPDSAEALGVRGYLQLRRGAWAEAEKDFGEALSLAPADPTYTFGRGLALIHLGRAREGGDEISIATLASASLVSEWVTRGFAPNGDVLPGRPVTTAAQPVMSDADLAYFLGKGEVLLPLTGGCSMIANAAGPQNLSWGGACRFGLLHGAGKLESSDKRFVYGREMTDNTGEVERKLKLAYQAAEQALAP